MLCGKEQSSTYLPYAATLTTFDDRHLRAAGGQDLGILTMSDLD